MIYIYYNNGRVLEGIVLSFGDRLVRVAVKDTNDAAEFRLVNQVWVSEDCEVVRLNFVDPTGLVAPVESEEGDPFETSFRYAPQPVLVRRVM